MSSKEGSGKKKYNLRSKPTDALKKSSNDDSDKLSNEVRIHKSSFF